MKRFMMTAGILVGLSGLAVAGFRLSVKPPPPRPKAHEVHAMAQLLVLKYLKSPRSAKFSGADQTTIEALSNGSYEIRGWVDAQNDFGSLLRRRYTIRVRPYGDDDWRSDHLALDPWEEWEKPK
jgi:hypothetical protein